MAFAEVPITETYTFTLSATFETHVLAPVVTVGSLIFFFKKKTPSCAIHHVVFCCLTFIFFTDPVVVDLSQLEYGIVTSYTYTITNHGLIAANDTTLQLPTNHPFLKFSWTNPGEVAANSTAVVLVQVTGGHARRRRTTSSCYVGLAGMNYSELIRIIHFTEVTI